MAEERKEGRKEDAIVQIKRCRSLSGPWAMRGSGSKAGNHVVGEKQRAENPRQGALWWMRDQDK